MNAPKLVVTDDFTIKIYENNEGEWQKVPVQMEDNLLTVLRGWGGEQLLVINVDVAYERHWVTITKCSSANVPRTYMAERPGDQPVDVQITTNFLLGK